MEYQTDYNVLFFIFITADRSLQKCRRGGLCCFVFRVVHTGCHTAIKRYLHIQFCIYVEFTSFALPFATYRLGQWEWEDAPVGRFTRSKCRITKKEW